MLYNFLTKLEILFFCSQIFQLLKKVLAFLAATYVPNWKMEGVYLELEKKAFVCDKIVWRHPTPADQTCFSLEQKLRHDNQWHRFHIENWSVDWRPASDDEARWWAGGCLSSRNTVTRENKGQISWYSAGVQGRININCLHCNVCLQDSGRELIINTWQETQV